MPLDADQSQQGKQMKHTRTTDRRGERGTVMVIAALAMTALLLFGEIAIDAGAIWSSRTQSQNADDSAALAAAATMIVQTGTNAATVDLNAARAEGAATPGRTRRWEKRHAGHGSDRFGGVNAHPRDFVFGTWNLKTRQLRTPDDDADERYSTTP